MLIYVQTIVLLAVGSIISVQCFLKARKPPQTSFPLRTSNVVDSIGIAFDKALDTVEDISLHARRLFPVDDSRIGQRPKVVVLGSGWAAHAFLKVIDTSAFQVTCISPRPFFIFTPMLASTAVGTVEYRSIVENVRAANPHIDYIEGEAVSVHGGEVEVKSKLSTSPHTFKVAFDTLVYSVGAQVADFGVSGVREHCSFIKEIEDVVKIKAAIFNAFEKASLPNTPDELIRDLLTFVIVGGGPTGVEFCGELSDFTREEVSRLYPKLKGRSRIILLNSASKLLSMFDRVLQESALESLQVVGGVDVRLHTRVTEVSATSLIYHDNLRNETVELSFSLCVWAAGNAVRPITLAFSSSLAAGQEESVKKTGRLLVDDWMRIQQQQQATPMYAIGDVSLIANNSLPQTAQVAAQQGAFLARHLNRGYSYSDQTPALPTDLWTKDPWRALRVRGMLQAKCFQFLNLGQLAYVGGSEAVAQVQLGDGDSIMDATGKEAFILWRSVYVVKQVSLRTRLLVIFDFIKTKIFGRDLTSL